jgi:cyclic beta-1,2-glucan synthetase
MTYAAAHGVPWGISESAYAACDHTLAYQYAPQGVPRLALRRSPPDELVIAPYATALAAQIAPRRANDNFAALEKLGVRERLGFIEALDYTPARQSGAGPFTPVRTFMAHHEGMSIVALANVLLDGAPRRWGMADPHLEAVASLLHERAPRAVSSLREPLSALPRSVRERRTPGLQRELLPGLHAVEPTQLLSNGRYNVALRPNGAGGSRWGDIGITRGRDDALRDALGSFCYLRWDRQPQAVSITQHPAPDPAAHYRCVFHADRVCFDAAWPELRSHATVWVSPEDDIEFRQIEVSNLGDRQLEIELLSAFEVTLADARADEAHPAFGNLFVRACWQSSHQALLFERTPRLGSERHLHMAHFLAESDDALLGVSVQTDRLRWQGRNRTASKPLASFDPAPSEGPVTLQTGLDPVCAMALRLSIAPGAKARLTFATAASDNLGTLNAVVDKYRQPSHVQRASLMSATLAGIRARTLRLSAEDFAAIQPLTTALLMNLTRPQQADDDAACDRRLLWRFGISGDRPLIGISAGAIQGIGLLRTMVQALRLWDWSAVACDLVVINAEPASYQMALQRELAALRETPPEQAVSGVHSTTLHVLRSEELSADELGTLHRLARIWLQADGRALPHHVQAWMSDHEADFDRRQASSSTALALGSASSGAHAPAGHFDAETGAFGFDVSPTLRPQRPWINVLANADFGCQVSEAGGGYTWALNSRLNQLTAWSNDPVGDPAGEWLLLQDLRTRETWSVAPGPHGIDGSTYRVVHGQGRSHIGHRHRDVLVTATWCVDTASSVKQLRLRVTNRGRGHLSMRAAAIVEWAMGASRSDRATVRTALHRQRLPSGRLTALLCTQREHAAGFGDGTAFLALAHGDRDADDDGDDWTCDRRECFDNRGRAVLPDHFGQHAGSGSDPCAALAITLSVPAGSTVERVFLMGYAASPDAAKQLAATAALVSAADRLEAVRRQWNELLGAATVSTPDPLFDVLVNRWLLYQSIACRLWAKAGFYQAGGATGFRDQLQDTMALAWAAPQMLRAQILLCASRQFAEGDAQHWWHQPTGAGVRTHFSDDLLWLPHACTRHLSTGGDTALLDALVPFLEAPAIPEGAEDSYSVPTIGSEPATLYEHAARAIDHSLRTGAHGLPLMGTGDWNDGMNRVGHLGRGESVWLGWFLCRVVADFAPIALARGDAERAARWQAAAAGWQAALGSAAWDGHWFTRAFFDDGQPLGSHVSEEARIDLIAQAWSVLSKVAPPDLAQQAMASAERHLADTEAGLMRLLDPPLQHSVPDAGYIQAYPPGVRENGGQYAHAAVWMLMAEAAQSSDAPGAAARAWRNFTWLSPAHRTADPLQGANYGLEPYVVAGDICSQPPYTGRGGWSWYTGAAGWLHRAAIESIFGLQLGVDELSFAPCLPPHWPQATLTLRRDGHRLHFMLQRDRTDARPPGHQELLPGAVLRWRDGPSEAWYVVPLNAAP